MGQDQSSGFPGQMGHPNVPASAHSVGKVKDDDGKSKSKQRAKLEDIMVVNAPTGKTKLVSKNEDHDIRNLNELPYFLPLLRSTVNVPASRDLDFWDKFDLRPCLSLCSRYEKHLKQCAEAVSFDQHMLSSQIREMDTYCASVLRRVNDRYKRLSQVAMQMKKVEEMNTNLRRIDANLKRLVPMMERLNNVLPDEERLEEFALSPYSIQR